MRKTDSLSFGRVLLMCLVAAGCSASGAASMGTGGSRANTGGSSGTTGGSTNSSGTATGGDTTGGGGSPSVGGGSATGGVPGTGGAPPTGGAPCQPGTTIGTSSTNYFHMAYPQLSPFYLLNNGWSVSGSGALTNAGQQMSLTALETCTPGVISWSTTFNWAGDTSSVRAYPAAILGWHNYGTNAWWINSSITGLPKPISSLTSIKCSWSFTPSGAATNVSFDLWVHSTTCSASAITPSTSPSDEVMIWLYSNGGVNPIGYNGSGTQVNAAGTNWRLYNGNVSSWAVHSFIREATTTSVTDLDVLALLKTSSLGLSSKCLTSIEAGTEIYNGSGTFKTNSYSCTVQ